MHARIFGLLLSLALIIFFKKIDCVKKFDIRVAGPKKIFNGRLFPLRPEYPEKNNACEQYKQQPQSLTSNPIAMFAVSVRAGLFTFSGRTK